MRKALLPIMALATVSACAGTSDEVATAPPPAAAPMVDPNSPLAAPMYMQMAASGDQFEIQSSQLALQQSRNPAVQAFAQTLIAHHQQMSATMMSAAQSAGLAPPPPALLPQHAALLDQLRAAGPNFDMAFRDAQVTAHQQALELHQNYSTGGDVPALRTVASSAVPIIQGHLAQAQGLNVTAATDPATAPIRSGERG